MQRFHPGYACAAMLLCMGSALSAGARASDDAELPRGQYQVDAQIVMPHLDEMRRISERELLCLEGDDLAVLFPVMRQRALTGCVLNRQLRDADGNYRLACQSDRVASGRARFTHSGGHSKGELEIKMGGKNMTFAQYIDAVRIGDCSTAE